MTVTMQAQFETALGQTFTDQYGDFKGRLKEVVHTDHTNTYRRAVFVATPIIFYGTTIAGAPV